MKKNKKIEENQIRQLTPEELAEEEKQYNSCKKPIEIGWAIFVISAALYLSTAFFAKGAMMKIPQKDPLSKTLKEYKNSQQYTDYISAIQNEALNQLTNAEITVEEYKYIIETSSNDKKFEEFLRTIENDEYVQAVIKDYDENQDQINTIGKKYSTLTITALSSLMVSTLILAKYRFKEMDIEDARKKREENQNQQMQ